MMGHMWDPIVENLAAFCVREEVAEPPFIFDARRSAPVAYSTGCPKAAPEVTSNRRMKPKRTLTPLSQKDRSLSVREDSRVDATADMS
jgi:hypothetical protein